MGCSPSKCHRSKLVSLCRRRCDLVTAALAAWSALGDSHSAHLLSLLRLSDALLLFADDALAVAPTPPKAPPFSSISIPDGSHLRLTTDSEFSHLHISSTSSPSSLEKTATTVASKARPVPQTPYLPLTNPYEADHHYMKHFPSAIPSGVYSDSGAKDWEFWDPFASYVQYPSRYKASSMASSVSSREVRRREGIPDLEMETESEIARASDGVKKSPPLRGKEGLHSKGKEVATSPECFFSASSWKGSDSGDSDGSCVRISSSVSGVEFMDGKGVGMPMEVGISCDSERSGTSYGAAMDLEGLRNVREVVWEIKKQFEIVVESGKELSKVLGVVDFRHQWSRGSTCAADSSRIPVSLSKLAYLVHPVHYSHIHKKTGYGYLQNLINTRTPCMSTLEELWLWEKKMYHEIKTAEELYTMQEKKFQQQTVLRERLQSDVAESKKSHQQSVLSGRKSQSQAAESLQCSLGKLRVKIDIAMRSVDFISGRIEKLRDEKLRPHIMELIRCSMAVWKCVLRCLGKQYRAIAECKISNLMAKTRTKKNDAVGKASRELENGIRNWSTCFQEWLQAQKAFISSLNKWLFSWIDTEPGITIDGMALFSPARIGAPSIVVICSDWHHAIRRISEDQVLAAMDDFSRNVHELRMIQHMEQQQRLKIEALSKEIAKKNGSEVELLDIRNTHLFTRHGDSTNHDIDAMESLRSKFIEEKDRHRETSSKMDKMAAGILRAGLIPVFEQLGLFTSDMIKAYDGLRIPGLKGRSCKVAC